MNGHLHNSFNLFHMMTTSVHDRHENLLLTCKLGEQLTYVTDCIIRYVQPFLILLSNAERYGMTVVKFYFLSYRILNYVHIYQLYKSRDRLNNFVQKVFREKCYRLRHLLGLSKLLDILQYVILNALTHLCRKQAYCT
jgi:hypothetical protein